MNDEERAMQLNRYLLTYHDQFGEIPKLMPLKDNEKAPAIQGRCALDSKEGKSLLVDGLEAVRQIRNDGVRGFAIYAGKPSHNTSDVVFVDHDSTEFKSPSVKPTFEVTTGSGGTHEHYRNDGTVRNSRVRDDWGEVRADNLYVVTPGSYHPSGNVYRITAERDMKTISSNELDDHMLPSTASQGGGDVSNRSDVSIPTVDYETDSNPPTAKAVADQEGWIDDYVNYGADDRSKMDYSVCMKMAEYGVPKADVRRLLDSSGQTKVCVSGKGYWQKTWSNAVAAASDQGIINCRSVDSESVATVRGRLDAEPVADGGRDSVAEHRLLNVAQALEDVGPASTSDILEHPAVDVSIDQIRRAVDHLESLDVVKWERSGRATKYNLVEDE